MEIKKHWWLRGRYFNDSAYYEDVLIEDLLGLTFSEVKHVGDTIEFTCYAGVFVMYHDQDCCETVYVEDIVGDLDDLVGSPILLAEKSTSNENPLGKYDDSFTWTFYKLATRKGYVDIRWYGSSNGYYSESVQFKFIPNKD